VIFIAVIIVFTGSVVGHHCEQLFILHHLSSSS